ncbi:MAG: AMP-binding protein [Clostridia bacterium]|nr:AMP-binding protein [Clostridia bacterium]
MNYQTYDVRHIRDIRDMLRSSTDIYAEKNVFLQKMDGEYKGITYATLRHDVEALGTALWAEGLAGKRIIVVGESCYSWCLSYLAVICGLGVVVPVDRELPAEEMGNIAAISEAAAVIYSPVVEAKVATLPESVRRIPFGDLAGLVEAGAAGIEAGEREYLDVEIDPHVMAALLFTSGTTGVSKGVMLSHHNICFNLEEMCQMLYIGPDDVFLSVLPMHHAYECTCGFLCQIYRGTTVAFCEGLRYITRNMKEVSPTKMCCVPLLVETLYAKIWAGIRKKGMEKKVKTAIKISNGLRKVGIDLTRKLFAEIHATLGGRLNTLISGGAAINPVVLEGLRDFGILGVQGYGLTECAPLAALNSDHFYRDDSAGLQTPNTVLDIYNPQEDGTGEIRFKGENIMLGYYNAPELTAEVKRGEWFYTGDLGFIDKDGFLHITGRKKNVIVTSNGKNIFPEELETYLGRNDFIKESVIVGIPNAQKKDYDIVAILVPDAERFAEAYGEGVTDEQINVELAKAVAGVNEIVQTYKRMDTWVRRDEEFPKNTSKKIKRAGLADAILPQYKEKMGL